MREVRADEGDSKEPRMPLSDIRWLFIYYKHCSLISIFFATTFHFQGKKLQEIADRLNELLLIESSILFYSYYLQYNYCVSLRT